MASSRETYTPGYSEPTLRLMLKRTAQPAPFFTPFNPNRLDFDLYSAYVFMIPMSVAMSQIQD